MYIGHFAVGLAAKLVSPTASIACQLLDFILPVLVMLCVGRVWVNTRPRWQDARAGTSGKRGGAWRPRSQQGRAKPSGLIGTGSISVHCTPGRGISSEATEIGDVGQRRKRGPGLWS
jgi:hypothetical protein